MRRRQHQLDARGIPHPRPYQINEYGASSEQNPGDGAWYIARLERAGADGLRANWASAGNLHNDLGNLLVRNSAGQHLPKGEWWVYRFYGSQTGQIVVGRPRARPTTRSPPRRPARPRSSSAAAARPATSPSNLQRLDTTSGIVQNNQVRVVAQRIPYNGGGAVQGPITVQNTIVTLSEQRHHGQPAAHQRRRDVHHHAAAAVGRQLPVRRRRAALPAVPGQHQPAHRRRQRPAAVLLRGRRPAAVELPAGRRRRRHLHASSTSRAASAWTSAASSTADGAAVHQWTCISGAQNQQFTLRKVDLLRATTPTTTSSSPGTAASASTSARSRPRPGRRSTSGPATRQAKPARSTRPGGSGAGNRAAGPTSTGHVPFRRSWAAARMR